VDGLGGRSRILLTKIQILKFKKFLINILYISVEVTVLSSWNHFRLYSFRLIKL
jgi:hypothetical protein